MIKLSPSELITENENSIIKKAQFQGFNLKVQTEPGIYHFWDERCDLNISCFSVFGPKRREDELKKQQGEQF